MNTTVPHEADVTKTSDCGNKVIAWFDEVADFSKRLISLDRVVRVLNQTNTGTGNEINVGASD